MKTIFNHRFMLAFFNFLLMICGVIVLGTGFYLFTDKKRLLLSSLFIFTPHDQNPFSNIEFNHSIFFYVAFILTILGMLIVTISFIGYWTTMLRNYCLLTIFFTLVLGLLMLKFSFCLVIAIWPQYLGLHLNATEMVKYLQSSYGVSGNEQFTVAMDFAQTYLDCCGINDSINYDTSLWKLQKLGRNDLTVPLTCCKLINKFEEYSYLDPKAVDLKMCQSIDPQEFQKGRNIESCLGKIENWYRENYIVLLCGSLVLTIVEFFVLLSIVLNCTSLKRKYSGTNFRTINDFNDEHMSSRAESANGNSNRENMFQDDFVSITPEIREIFVQPYLLNNDSNQRLTRDKTRQNNYSFQKSYLI